MSRTSPYVGTPTIIPRFDGDICAVPVGNCLHIGYFFKNKQVSRVRTDLLIFITPRIVKSTANTQKSIDNKLADQRKKMLKELAEIMGRRKKMTKKQPKPRQK